VELAVGLYEASASLRHLVELIELRLERVRLAAPVAAVRIGVLRAGPLRLAQQTLLDDAPRSLRGLAALVDRLVGRLGRRAVVRACLVDDVQPEYACQYLPAASLNEGAGSRFQPKKIKHRDTVKRLKTAPDPLGGLRPLCFWQRPPRLAVVAVAPDGPPARFRFAGREHHVAHSWGPERIETGWWRGRCVRRDYYRVETAEGRRFWLFRQLNTGRWHLQGEFE
jgi:protein ImuB